MLYHLFWKFQRLELTCDALIDLAWPLESTPTGFLAVHSSYHAVNSSESKLSPEQIIVKPLLESEKENILNRKLQEGGYLLVS